jgi:general secretion pathway protein J
MSTRGYGCVPGLTDRQKGFTLMEILVVLVITSLITGLLLDGLFLVSRLQVRFGPEIYQNQRGAMYRDWFRLTVNSLMPDYPDGGNRFKGDAHSFSGLTLSPLDQPSGAMLSFAWSLRFDPESGQTQLIYESGENRYPVESWPGNAGRFLYLDAEGNTHDEWPPFAGGADIPQLPRAIYLEMSPDFSPKVVIAVPMGPSKPLPRLKDMDG